MRIDVEDKYGQEPLFTTLRKHLDGYEDPQEYREEEATSLRKELPFMADIGDLKTDYVGSLSYLPSSGKLAKGVAAYGIFVMLTGINLILLGIGFNPIAWKIVFEF